MRKVIFGLLVFSFFEANAAVRAISLSSEKTVKASRWMYEKNSKNRGVYKSLENLKRALNSGQNSLCMKRATPLYSQVPSLSGWLALTELKCLRGYLSGEKVNRDRALAVLNRIEARPSWLLYGPHKKALRETLVDARLALIEKDIKNHRQRAWSSIAKLESMDWLDKKQKANLYRLAGELAFLEQKMKAARGFVLQSLASVESPALREKLSSIEKALAEEKPPSRLPEKGLPAEQIETSEKEKRLEKRINVALRAGELVTVAEDAVELMTEFPGGRRAEWARGRVLNAYFKAHERGEKGYFSAKGRILREMRKADGIRLQGWAETLYRRGHYKEALVLAKRAYGKLSDSSRGRKILKTAGLSALYMGDFDDSTRYFHELVKKHAGSEEAVRAVFRLGLLYYRMKEFEKSATFLQRLIALKPSDSLELSGRYWLWRALQKTDTKRAEGARQSLVQRFPLTYYGLRAQAESQDDQITKPSAKAEAFKAELWLTATHRKTWKRMNTLLRAGWLEEAQAELRTLPPPQGIEAKRIMAQYWAASFDHLRATRLAREALPQETRWKDTSYLELAFPLEFAKLIQKESEKRKLSVALVQSMIRQESSYRPKAVSHAGALGLMQLIPSTANEVADQLGYKGLKLPEDLFDVERNIEFGTHYISRMLDRFKGNIPLALAAYNAGPTRLKRWLKGRSLLEPLLKSQTSHPDQEIWIDELPWGETNFYVKSILRNYLVYRTLDEGQVKLSDPIWR